MFLSIMDFGSLWTLYDRDSLEKMYKSDKVISKVCE